MLQTGSKQKTRRYLRTRVGNPVSRQHSHSINIIGISLNAAKVSEVSDVSGVHN